METNIPKLITESGKKLTEISSKTGIPYPTLSGYNQGIRIPKRENAEKLAKYFNVSIEYLLGQDDNRKKMDIIGFFEHSEQKLGIGYFETIQDLEKIYKKTLFNSPIRDRLEEIRQEKNKLNQKIDELEAEAKNLRKTLDKEVKERLELLKK
ncbi:TPA: helix-turn-helix domain-containing protein [Streptococcus agalactiae]|nr:helix-turn-helix domain-containing protein [Streptococcus agalactiae]HEN7527538.1 helix-turn-helix domain-containing protein [Streptococcus agalactiae]